MDAEFKKNGAENVYLPLVIASSQFQKEKDHIAGFAPETLVCTEAGGVKLDDPLIVRPTSEVLFCNHYKNVIQSYRDLPKIYNQWCSVVRWEKTTRPFLRGSEFLWQEGHTMHASEVEARELTLKILDVYDRCGKELLAIPFVKGRKTEKEKFAGAKETYSIEALMHDGKALQCGTSHYFGQDFAKAFGIQYLDKDGKIKTPYQTSWGVSTRLLGAIIMVHGDDNGLVLPPFVAPTQVMIVPIQIAKEGVLAKCKDIENNHVMVVRRVDSVKKVVDFKDIKTDIVNELNDIHETMYKKALSNLLNNITEVHSLDELKKVVDKGGYAKMMWDGDVECENKIKEATNATSRCMPFDQAGFDDKCAICGKPAKYVVLFAKAY